MMDPLRESWATPMSPPDPRYLKESSTIGSTTITSATSHPEQKAHMSKVYGQSTLSTISANMRLATATFAGPLINDNAEAILCDFYSDEELESVTLLQLYHRSCALLGARPNAVVERHLPSTIQYKPYLKIHIIDLSKTYLGPTGAAAVVPIVSACRRLSHLLLPGVGMSHNVALALIERLSIHPCVREIDLSRNDLGTKVGERLLRLVSLENKRIYRLGLQDTLIIPAIKKKIDAALAKNYYLRNEYAPDFSNLALLESQKKPKNVIKEEDSEVTEALKAAKRAEEERIETAKRLKYEAYQQLPAWFPVAAAELSGVLNRQRDRINEVMAVFTNRRDYGTSHHNTSSSAAASNYSEPPQTVSVLALSSAKVENALIEADIPVEVASSPIITSNSLTEAVAVHLDALCDRVPLRNFQRAMKIFNVTSLMDSSDRCALFVECFGALYLDLSLADAIEVAQRKMASESARNVVALVEKVSRIGEPHDNSNQIENINAGIDIIAATSTPNTGTSTLVIGTAESDKVIAQLPLEKQLEVANLPVHQFFHHTPKPPSRGGLRTSRPTSAGGRIGPADGITFTRYLAEDQKDLLLVNVTKIIHALRVHASDAIRRKDDTMSKVGEVEGVDPLPPAVMLRLRALSLQKWLFEMLSDRLYDVRNEVIECCNLLDADNEGLIYFHELCSGIGSVCMVSLFAHRKEISRYIKLINAIEALELRTVTVQSNLKNESIALEGANNAESGDMGAENAPESLDHLINPSYSYEHDTDRDLDYMGTFVQRYLRLLLERGGALLNPVSGASMPPGDGSVASRQSIIQSSIPSTNRIEAFARVPFRSLFGTDFPLISITDAAAEAHAASRSTPNFWAHATKNSLQVLMNPRAIIS